MSVIELVLLTYAFRHDGGLRYRVDHALEGVQKSGRMKEAFKNKITWICAIYLLAYVGAECTWCHEKVVNILLIRFVVSIYWGLDCHLHATCPFRLTVRFRFVCLWLLGGNGTRPSDPWVHH